MLSFVRAVAHVRLAAGHLVAVGGHCGGRRVVGGHLGELRFLRGDVDRHGGARRSVRQSVRAVRVRLGHRRGE